MASSSQPAAAQNQATRLEAEGVTVRRDAMGEMSVDFDEYGWFPDVLPSEAAGGAGNDDDDDNDDE